MQNNEVILKFQVCKKLIIRIHSNSVIIHPLSSSDTSVDKHISFKNTGPAKHDSFVHL